MPRGQKLTSSEEAISTMKHKKRLVDSRKAISRSRELIAGSKQLINEVRARSKKSR